MAKRKVTATIDNRPTELVLSIEEFNSALDERISLGQELHNRNITTNQEFDALKEEYSDWSDYNLEYLKHSFNKEHNEYRKDYDDTSFFFGMLGGRQSSAEELKEFKDKINKKVKNLKQLRAKTGLLKQSSDVIVTESKQEIELDQSQVFIVHGHDDEATSKTARFVEKLGFEAIILREKASGSNTIIEKIEEYSNVGFGIVLYTPCDIGAKQTESPDLKSRARQNVVFEHGFLIGKIGRSKVCALVKGDIETPNDISGVVYVSMDSAEAWRYAIADEMKKAGYKVDKNKI